MWLSVIPENQEHIDLWIQSIQFIAPGLIQNCLPNQLDGARKNAVLMSPKQMRRPFSFHESQLLTNVNKEQGALFLLFQLGELPKGHSLNTSIEGHRICLPTEIWLLVLSFIFTLLRSPSQSRLAQFARKLALSNTLLVQDQIFGEQDRVEALALTSINPS